MSTLKIVSLQMKPSSTVAFYSTDDSSQTLKDGYKRFIHTLSPNCTLKMTNPTNVIPDDALKEVHNSCHMMMMNIENIHITYLCTDRKTEYGKNFFYYFFFFITWCRLLLRCHGYQSNDGDAHDIENI